MPLEISLRDSMVNVFFKVALHSNQLENELVD